MHRLAQLVIGVGLAVLWGTGAIAQSQPSTPAQGSNQAQTQTQTSIALAGNQMIALRTALARCPAGGQIVPFVEPSLQVNGARYFFNQTPPGQFQGGAAIAALYRVAGPNGQMAGQFCVDGACLAAGNQCSAIAFIQPNGVRIYTRR